MLLLFDVSASMTVFGLEDDSFVDMEKILISGNHHMQVFLQCFFFPSRIILHLADQQ